MAETVAGAELDVVPAARGFASKLVRQVSPDLRRAGETSGRQFGDSFHRGLKGAVRLAGGTLGISGALGLASLVKDSVTTEAAFSQRMAQIKANVSGATDASIANLSKLAIKLGNDTVFSANDAADAMLEMAKGGFTQAQIAGGGVQATMALAAAEGMSLADAATIVSNNMNAYSIKATNATRITDALAAGSAASTASVTSLADGLSNVGGVARNFGFNINDTVGVLAAFDQNALRGAEGGTALRSLLTHLAAPTQKATDELDGLGISLTKRNGDFRDVTNIAEQFQTKLGKLSQAEQARVSKVIAGAYGQRALNVLVKEGAKGLDKYIESTKVQGKAQQLASARMSGTAGAIERLHGSVETAELAIGKALAPTVIKFAGYLTNKAVPATTSFITDMQKGTGTAGEIRDVIEDVVHVGAGLVKFFGNLPGPVQKFGIEGLIAYGVLRKLQTGFAGARLGVLGMASSLVEVRTETIATAAAQDRYTANSVVQASQLQTTNTRTALSLNGLKSAAVSAAGVGGLMLLYKSTQQTDAGLSSLEGAAGGALSGASLGAFAGPPGVLIGAGLGSIAGFALSLAHNTDSAGDAAVRSVAKWTDLTGTLDDVSAAMTGVTRAQLVQDLTTNKVLPLTRAIGLQDREVANAILLGGAARVKVTAAIKAQLAAESELYTKKDLAILQDRDSGKISINESLKQQLQLGKETRARTDLLSGLLDQVKVVKQEVAGKRQAIAANRDYGKSLNGLPDPKKKFIENHDILNTAAAVAKLAGQIHLTPREINIVLKATNTDATLAQIRNISREADIAARTRHLIIVAQGQKNRAETSPTARANGGGVRRGVPYEVGEYRRELFIPNQDGRIERRLPASAAAPSAAAGTVTLAHGARLVLAGPGGTAFEAYVDNRADGRVAAAQSMDGETRRAGGDY